MKWRHSSEACTGMLESNGQVTMSSMNTYARIRIWGQLVTLTGGMNGDMDETVMLAREIKALASSF